MDFDRNFADKMLERNMGCSNGIVCALIVCAVIITSFCGCKTKYVSVPEYHTEYVYRTDSVTLRDSIWQHDSVFVSKTNDTVTVEKWRTKYVEHLRDVVKIDSFIRVDSIRIPIPVERKLSFKERMYITIGKIIIWPTLIIIVALIIYLVLKFRRR